MSLDEGDPLNLEVPEHRNQTKSGNSSVTSFLSVSFYLVVVFLKMFVLFLAAPLKLSLLCNLHEISRDGKG